MAYGSSNPRGWSVVGLVLVVGCGAPVQQCHYDRDCPSTEVCLHTVCVMEEPIDAGFKPSTPDAAVDAGSTPIDSGTPSYDAGTHDAGAPDAGAVDAGPIETCDPATMQCGCHPKTCADLGATCGVNVPDGCGGVIASCGLGLACTGAQMVCNTARNQCECQPKTCADLGASCGVNVPDGCGGTIAQCGVGADCGAFSHCGQTLSCQCNSTIDVPDDAFQDTNCDGIDGDESDAVFVSTLGSDTAVGTDRNHPFASLNRAFLELASSPRHFIFIAAGMYLAPTRAWPNGASLVGGYDAAWNRTAASSARALMSGPATGLLISGTAQPTLIERVVMISANAGAPGTSSIGLRLVNTGSSVSLRFVEVNAGHASDGVSGVTGGVGARGLDGYNGSNAPVHQPTICSSGAIGGGANGLRGGQGGCDAQPSGGAAQGGTPGGSVGCQAANGAAGWAGGTGAMGTSGSWGSGYGTFQSDGWWYPTSAMEGGSGNPGDRGQGGDGGGGGGKQDCGIFGPWEAGAEGGGGGSGGNGGMGGTGGKPGGASIAMVVVNSNPTFTNVLLTTRGGGNGGTGGVGGPGGAGGAGGSGGFGVTNGPGNSGNGGRGGSGGRGGTGGPGGSGQGGPSIGVACVGSVSTVLSPQVQLGPAGSNAFSAGLQAAKLNCP